MLLSRSNSHCPPFFSRQSLFLFPTGFPFPLSAEGYAGCTPEVRATTHLGSLKVYVELVLRPTSTFHQHQQGYPQDQKGVLGFSRYRCRRHTSTARRVPAKKLMPC